MTRDELREHLLKTGWVSKKDENVLYKHQLMGHMRPRELRIKLNKTKASVEVKSAANSFWLYIAGDLYHRVNRREPLVGVTRADDNLVTIAGFIVKEDIL